MKHKLLILLMLLCALPIHAQMMSVRSFTPLEMDLDGRVFSVNDQNGKKCALIKVVTTEQGFTFDVGYLGVRKVEYKTAEIWVYVPEQTSKIKIAHPKLGQLDTDTKDGYYWFPIGGVKSSCVYRLELVSGRVITTVEEATVETGYLMITTEPEGADVYLADEKGSENYVGKTPFQQKMAYGRYRFRLELPHYHSEPGYANIESDRAVYPIRMRPQFGTLQLTSTPEGAKAYIEELNKEYITPCTIERVPSGEYTVRVSKERYRSATKEVEVKDEQTTQLDVPLEARFAQLTINTLEGGNIYIDGKYCGSTTYSEELLEGFYDIEVRLTAHKAAKKQVQMVAYQPQEITLTPTPIYGSLDVMTTPWDATVTLNGKEVGLTPLTINKLLIGNYEMVISKQGYRPITKSISVEEGQHVNLTETLASNGTTPTPAPAPTPAPTPAPKPIKEQPVKEKPAKEKPIKAKLPNSFFFTANGGYRLLTTPSVGLTLGQELNRSGWYLSANTGFGFQALSATAVCDAEGIVTNGETPFYNGKYQNARLTVVAGALVRLHSACAIYAGVGYGYNSQAWQTEGGNWVRNANRTIQGADIQAGMHFNIKGFVLRAGFTTTNFKTAELNIGIGGAIKKK